eukprot:Gb_41664 [translate_table: standard]
MLKSIARLTKLSLTMADTKGLSVNSWSALNCATTAFKTSFPMEGSTLSS